MHDRAGADMYGFSGGADLGQHRIDQMSKKSKRSDFESNLAAASYTKPAKKRKLGFR